MTTLTAARPLPARFTAHGQVFHADTCASLATAAKGGAVTLAALARGHYPGRRLPDGELPEVASVGYWDAPRDQRWGLDWHRNEGVEITYLARGSLPFATDDRPYLLRRGQMTITRPWQRHRVGGPHVTASRLCWLILDVGVRRPNQPWRWPDWLVCSPRDLDRLTTLLRHNERPVWAADREVGWCFDRIADAVGGAGRRSNLTRLRLHVNELLVATLEMLAARRVTLDERLSSSQRTVELFLADDLPRRVAEPWTLDAMAAACGLGRTRFAGYCLRATNLPPARYLARCRVEAAKAMLRAGPAISITEVGARCGFASSQYFATTFRRLTGQTPRACRDGARIP